MYRMAIRTFGVNKIQNIFDEHQLIILNDFDKELSPVIEPFISVAEHRLIFLPM